MTPERACRLHGLDIVRAYAPHLLKKRPKPVLRLVHPAPEPPPPPEPPAAPPAINRIVGLHAHDDIKAFVREVCERHRVNWHELASPARTLRFVAPRREIYVFLKDRGWSYTQIGKLCCRDHTSIVHALQKVRS